MEKEINKIASSITSSKSKRNYVVTQLNDLLERLKKMWYKKLLVKLNNIKNGSLNLDDYIAEVEAKTE